MSASVHVFSMAEINARRRTPKAGQPAGRTDATVVQAELPMNTCSRLRVRNPRVEFSTPPTPSTLPTSPPADSYWLAFPSLSPGWYQRAAGFSACLLAVVVLGMRCGARRAGTAPAAGSTIAASPAAADANRPHREPASVDEASGTGASVPASPLPNAERGQRPPAILRRRRSFPRRGSRPGIGAAVRY